MGTWMNRPTYSVQCWEPNMMQTCERRAVGSRLGKDEVHHRGFRCVGIQKAVGRVSDKVYMYSKCMTGAWYGFYVVIPTSGRNSAATDHMRVFTEYL